MVSLASKYFLFGIGIYGIYRDLDLMQIFSVRRVHLEDTSGVFKQGDFILATGAPKKIKPYTWVYY